LFELGVEEFVGIAIGELYHWILKASYAFKHLICSCLRVKKEERYFEG